MATVSAPYYTPKAISIDLIVFLNLNDIHHMDFLSLTSAILASFIFVVPSTFEYPR